MMGYVFVFLGAGLGGVLRHSVNMLALRLGAVFPWHTLTVNVVGGLLMGMLAGVLASKGSADEPWRLFAATGILGGFTTFSAFSLDAVALWERGAGGSALAYVVASVVVSIAALVLGLWLTRVT